MFGVKRKLENFSIILEDNSKRVDNTHEYIYGLSKRLNDVEKIKEDFKNYIEELKKENTALKIEVESSKKSIWKLENPPKYKVGDKPFANLMVIRVIFIEKKFLELDKPAYFWDYEVYNSKTKKTGKYDI